MNLPRNKIIQGDCINILETFPEDSIDLIFADPPYNLQLQNHLWRPNMTKVNAVEDDWDKFSDFAEYDAFTIAWLSACRRVLKRTGTIWVIGMYHNIYRIGAIMQTLNFWILNDIAWIKTNPMPNFRGVRFTNAHETLIWAQKCKGETYTFNHHAMKALNDDLQMRSDWYLPICTGKERIRNNGKRSHATQKPEALLYRIILASSDPGDIILDPFFGSGTTGAVAKKLHRNWIGIEQNPIYIDIAEKRLDATQPALFEATDLPNPRRQVRIPFGTIVENGLLTPGQKLYFGQEGNVTAIVLSNGHIRWKDTVGSIHQIGRAIQNAPCNGWEYWYYDTSSGQRLPIDRLRQEIRIKMKLGENT